MKISKSSGNVFADLGFPNAEEMQLQAKLVYEIFRLLEARRWSAQRVANELDWPLSAATALLQGAFIEMPVERLLAALKRLNQRVEIMVKVKQVA